MTPVAPSQRRRSPRSRAVLAALLAAIAVGCGSSSGSGAPGSGLPSSGPATSGQPAGASGVAPSASALASLAPGMFRNPVIAADFPDPFILAAEGRYYAYATTDVAQNLQLARSDDLVTWEILDDPLPKLPGWSSGDTWAPEVLKTSAGYVLYYTAHDSEIRRPDGNGSQCLTRAVSKSPEGPFVDDSKEPMVCQKDLGGSIDSTTFVDGDGAAWMIWKNDGNCCREPTRFYLQRLTADGLKVTGPVTDLGVVNDAAWEGFLIEAPTLIERDGTFYLFFSANGYDTAFYAVGYATAKKLAGPYVDAPENPILTAVDEADGTQARGPGHQSIVTDKDGDLWMAYHAWDDDAVGYGNFGQRSVWIDPLTLSDGKATVTGPTDQPQPVP
jgi:beta-xylosidase